MTDSYLEIEFELERLQRYLKQNPQQAVTLALNNFEDFLNLSRETKILQQKYKSVLADNQRLTSQLIETTSTQVTLPSFLECNQH
jgi:hypothetical protein